MSRIETPSREHAPAASQPRSTDAQIVAVVAENVFTNFLNIVAQTEIDFPVVHAADLG